MTSGQILLMFDEPIDPNGVDVTGITIQGSTTVTNSSMYYTLTSTSQFYVDGGVRVRISLSDADFDALQSRPNVATQQSNTYVSVDPRTVTDQASPPNQAQPISNAQVTIYYGDTTQPQITAFSLNLDANSMTLTFSEPVVLSTFVPNRLTIRSNRNLTPGVISYNITGGRIQSTQLTVSRSFSFSLAHQDITYLKTRVGLATNINDTFLSALQGVASDTNNNPSMALLPLPVSTFTVDTSAPQVVAFDLNMDQGLLTLYFNDVIDASTFNGSAITLQSAPAREPIESYTVRNAVHNTFDNGFVIAASLSTIDLNEIKRVRNLCKSRANCFMTTTASVVHDVYGASTIPIPDGDAIIVLEFFADFTRPLLYSWELDMDEGLIHMTFDEPVNFTSFHPDELTLHSGLETDHQYQAFSLTGHAGLIPPDIDNGTVLIVQLRQDDVNFIKASVNLGTNQNNSFLSMTQLAIVDINYNSVEPVLARQVTRFAPDTTSPSLLWFSLNAHTGVLSLMFDEIVNALTFNASGLTLISRELPPHQVYPLTGGTVANLNSTILHLNMREDDLIEIKAIGLGTSANNTYISATDSTIRDMNDNTLNPISINSPRQVLYYTDSPILISFEFPTYIFNEGQRAILRVVLNATATPDVSFTVMTEDNEALGTYFKSHTYILKSKVAYDYNE